MNIKAALDYLQSAIPESPAKNKLIQKFQDQFADQETYFSRKYLDFYINNKLKGENNDPTG